MDVETPTLAVSIHAMGELEAAPPAAGFTEMLLGGPSPGEGARGLPAAASAGLRAEAARLGTGLGLASLYGVALGARDGGAAIVIHSVGVPATLAAVLVLGVPAFAILLGLADAPIGALSLARTVARSAATAGIILAGLSPIVALFVITAESPSAAAFTGAMGLGAACLLAMRRFALDLKGALGEAPAATRTITGAATAGLGLFAAVLIVRVSASALPMLGGGQ